MLDFFGILFDSIIIFRTWVMVKLLHVGHGGFLWNFNTTFSMNCEIFSKLILGLRKLLEWINEYAFMKCDIKWYDDVGYEFWLKLWSFVICVKNESWYMVNWWFETYVLIDEVFVVNMNLLMVWEMVLGGIESEKNGF